MTSPKSSTMTSLFTRSAPVLTVYGLCSGRREPLHGVALAVPLGPAPAMRSEFRADLKSATMTSVVVDCGEVI